MSGKAAPNKVAEISDPSPNTDRPPRLATCINERKVDPDRTPAGDNTWAIAADESVDVEHLEEILSWIATMLEDDAGLDTVWDTPAGQHPNAEELSANAEGENEETWAKLMDQLFLGSAYGGPDIVASFPGKGRIGGAGHTYIMERFMQWDGDQLSLEDPAYSLAVACQQLTTYGALGRGVRLATDLKAIGIPASQAACCLPIFKGSWHSPKKVKLLGVELPIAPLTSAEAHDANKAADKVKGFGPGTIYTYNPALFNEFLLTEVRTSDLRRDKNDNIDPDPATGLPQVDAAAAIRRVVAAQQETKDANKRQEDAAAFLNKGLQAAGVPGFVAPNTTEIFSGVKAQLDPTLSDLSEEAKNALGISTAVIPVKVQLDGSHVSMVLRRYKLSDNKTEAVQLLDASAHTDAGAGSASKTSLTNDYLMFANVAAGRGIFAGEGYSKIKGNSGYFVGLGTLPAIREPDAVFESLRRARPVGLARLILAARKSGSALLDDDIYFVSRMIPMWGTATPYQNYSISRLLWSLRNTPYRRDIQAYWMVYAPRGVLAEAMWNSGSRETTLEEFEIDAIERANEYKPANKPDRLSLHTGTDLASIALLSHDEAGRAIEIWRAHCLTGTGEGTPPKVIRELFIMTGSPPLSLILKRQAELIKAKDAEVARRKQRQREKEKERDDAIRRAQRGEAGMRELIDAINAEIRAIWAAPMPEADAIWDWLDLSIEEKADSELVIARSNPSSTYQANSVPEALELPELLQ